MSSRTQRTFSTQPRHRDVLIERMCSRRRCHQSPTLVVLVYCTYAWKVIAIIVADVQISELSTPFRLETWSGEMYGRTALFFLEYIVLEIDFIIRSIDIIK